jgi:hypothetical protein
MTVTRLKRKDRKNLARAVNKTRVIKQLLYRPVIKNVDEEALKAKYGTVTAAPKAAVAAPKKEEAVAAAPVAAEPAADEAEA